jgi:hypothetical protein
MGLVDSAFRRSQAVHAPVHAPNCQLGVAGLAQQVEMDAATAELRHTQQVLDRTDTVLDRYAGHAVERAERERGIKIVCALTDV